jgi:multisubunit Na+/H+ antiporter MnhB subunit
MHSSCEAKSDKEETKMKENTKKKLIYVRYLLPPVLMLLTLAVMLIPAYLFVVDGEVNAERVSALKLMSNSYEQARMALFGGEEQTEATLLFSRILLTLTVLLPLLFAIAFAAAVYSAVIALLYFNGSDEERTERYRTVFITLIPNRIFLSLLEALILPFCLFPYLMSSLYKWVFTMNVVMTLNAPDGLIVGGIVIALTVVLSVVCATWERQFDADIFKKRKAFEEEREEQYQSAFTYREEERESEEDDAARERNERIRQLFSNQDGD